MATAVEQLLSRPGALAMMDMHDESFCFMRKSLLKSMADKRKESDTDDSEDEFKAEVPLVNAPTLPFIDTAVAQEQSKKPESQTHTIETQSTQNSKPPDQPIVDDITILKRNQKLDEEFKKQQQEIVAKRKAKKEKEEKERQEIDLIVLNGRLIGKLGREIIEDVKQKHASWNDATIRSIENAVRRLKSKGHFVPGVYQKTDGALDKYILEFLHQDVYLCRDMATSMNTKFKITGRYSCKPEHFWNRINHILQNVKEYDPLVSSDSVETRQLYTLLSNNYDRLYPMYSTNISESSTKTNDTVVIKSRENAEEFSENSNFVTKVVPAEDTDSMPADCINEKSNDSISKRERDSIDLEDEVAAAFMQKDSPKKRKIIDQPVPAESAKEPPASVIPRLNQECTNFRCKLEKDDVANELMKIIERLRYLVAIDGDCKNELNDLISYYEKRFCLMK